MAKEATTTTTAATNKTVGDKTAPKTVTTTASPSLSLGTKIILALVSLALGILTPPLLVRADPVVKPATEDCETQPDGTTTCMTDTMGSEEALFPCSDETLSNYLHNDPVPGYHVVCFSEVHNDMKAHHDFLQITYHLNGAHNKMTTQTFPKPAISWKNVKFAMQRKMDLTMNETIGEFQPWAIFTPMGQRITDAEMRYDDQEMEDLILQVLLKYQTVLVYEGGQFMWPGVRLGFARPVNLYSIMPMGDPDLTDKHQQVTLHTMSLNPLVLLVDDFLTDNECDYIQLKAEPTLKYSDVVLMDKDQGRPASDFRTSQSTFVSSRQDPTLLDVELRTASLVRIPRQHQEDVQVLRYGMGEKYDHHHDYFDPKLYANDKNTLAIIGNGRRNRLATVFWYLSDVAEGGETAFPRFGGLEPLSMQDCERGLMVKPVKGRVIIFYSLLPNGQPDPASLHGACPVKEGVKWAANKWVWNEPMEYVRKYELEDVLSEL